jgi:hypothetical protein
MEEGKGRKKNSKTAEIYVGHFQCLAPFSTIDEYFVAIKSKFVKTKRAFCQSSRGIINGDWPWNSLLIFLE